MGSRLRGLTVPYPACGNTIMENNTRKSISITVLDLDTDEAEGKTEDKDVDMRETKMIQEFQTRKKYNNVRKVIDVDRDRTLLELGISGTRYSFGGKGTHRIDTYASAKSVKAGKEERRNETAEDKSNMSARLAIPLISPRSAKSENSPFRTNSLLGNEFGFREQDTDTFCGMYFRCNLEPSELEKELEVQSKRHIYACSNLGSVRKTSRAAQSVIRLKNTMAHGIADGLSKGSDGDTLHRPGLLINKKVSLVTYSRLRRSVFKSSVHLKEDLPAINGSSLLNVVAGRGGV